MSKYPSRNLLASSILSAMLASQAYAQGPASPAPSNGDQAATQQAGQESPASQSPASEKKAVQLQNVMVTAQHRKEESQKVPISISTISGPQLERMQVRTIEDVKFSVPNIVIENNTALPSGAKIFMRGVGQDESMFTTDPGIAIYIDDVYIPRANGAMLDLYDVERVEVLRGPQGTLYGRNATGGAIRYVTRKPDGKDTLKLDTTLGNFGRRDVRVSFGTKVGKIDVSGAVMSRNRDGYIHDLTHDRMVNDSHVNAARLNLAMAVTDTTYATLNMDYLRETSGAVYPTPVKFGTNGKMVPVLGSLYQTRTNTLGDYGLRQYGVAFTSDTDFGSFSLRNILHTRGMSNRFYEDLDGTDQTRFHLLQDQKQRQYGYEAQLASQIEGPFSWVGGVFAFRETNSQPTRQDIFAVGPTNNISQQTQAYALYWQGTYKITDRLRFIGGGRYSRESKDFLVVSTKANGTPNFTSKQAKNWTRPDWKLGLDYDFTDDVMGYATVTTGFKSGGFNGRGGSAATVNAVNAETMRAYEVGVKSSLLNNRVQLNANYYRNDYAALQLSAVLPGGGFSLANATGALIQGVEMDAQVQLTQHWHASAGFGTIDAKYQNFAAINRASFDGKALKDAPKFQWFLSSTYIQPLDSADLVWSAQLRYTDMYYESQALSRLVMTPTHLDAAARIAYEPRSKDWSVALWGKNLTNNKISAGGFDIPAIGVGIVYPTMPRTFGVDFSYRFR
ncbi:MAG: TonB-dependent receptor [Rhodanobacter sp.]